MSKQKKQSFAVASAGYSITLNAKVQNVIGNFSLIAQTVADLGASIAEVYLKYSDFNYNERVFTINAQSAEKAQQVIAALEELDCIEVESWQDDTFAVHEGGKLDIVLKSEITNSDDLARAYTPGVGRVCQKIYEEPESVYQYTIKNNCVAVVSDGSAVLGLGNIGPEASLPVMEGKAALFKEFAGINSFPICLATQDTDEIVSTVKQIAPVFSGINLEDISAPRCFEIEERLIKELNIPVFHDDQHGTAVVVLAGILNATKLMDRKLKDLKVVVNGFGAGGVACIKIMLNAGIKNIIACDTAGVAYEGRKENMNPMKEELAKITNPEKVKGSMADALKGADLFIGVSKAGLVTREMVKSMNKDPIIFALANPVPEILPDEVKDIVGVIATGRSDYANQVNNVLCFPGIFKGALDCRAERITMKMKVAAAQAIAGSVSDSKLSRNYFIPSVFSKKVSRLVAEAVKETAIQEGVARVE